MAEEPGAAVLIETSLGDIVIDLWTKDCPATTCNFLKLCKIYYYNLNAFFNVSKNFLAQVGDPEATGKGGNSIEGVLNNRTKYFTPEIKPSLKHKEKGTVSMAVSRDNEGKPGCGSQFFITLGENISYLDGKHAPFGQVVEGLDTLEKMNEVYVDSDGRPYKDVRIRHVVILEDPFDDPASLVIPNEPPTDVPDANSGLVRIGSDEDLEQDLDEEVKEKRRRDHAASASALTLEMVGDLPFAEIRPPENILFVCKLNPVTRDEDLELIFSRFGKILSCEVIRDKNDGSSLCYAFIEFDQRESAEAAYFRMQNVLVDDRRIFVDFSQSVSKLHTQWLGGQGKKGRHTRESAPRRDLPKAGGAMVFDLEERDRREQKRQRSRSPRRDDRRGGYKKDYRGSRDDRASRSHRDYRDYRDDYRSSRDDRGSRHYRDSDRGDRYERR
ncbi:cyclophilin-like protein [Wallemia mellicola]|uniref:Peptidyl-prolyl cis-trans isomerase n=1 Tax=Wallemia mellicola TaxID=1708541 RepID=A0A4T0RQ70_9BASI|nr:cyclophilin-like protein [Wallemia mellicola]TIC01343.1 cyclophilin-like protein [Wallemia mellicola]TIC40572.1 cyclophilin-like protein [Wallemia mellicola]